MEIGTKIKKLRELRNFTQEYMAKNLEMTPSGYGKIERDETEVSYQKLEKIAEVLGLKIEDIINFNEQIVFNVMHNQTGNGYVIHNGISEQERKLYEQIIAQQKEEIENLRKIIEKMQNK
ncbi:helix-turn-helix domain-containing protein [Emticicia agri]|uniref:XRE family transcriptional regulator n=1 Tax=Emticicia agri TaxID=2492393 RepID=A0A4Q5LQQ6_9BACT|nr:helix-turn-helix domain-containing protein [Emticicia agri]RYU91785.1 XRE family transcriptional regulator [Emticicia agri]